MISSSERMVTSDWGWEESPHILYNSVPSHTPVKKFFKLYHGRDCKQIARQTVLQLVVIHWTPLLDSNSFGTVLPSSPFSLYLSKFSCFLHFHNSFLILPLYMQKKEKLTGCPGLVFFRKAPRSLSAHKEPHGLNIPWNDRICWVGRDPSVSLVPTPAQCPSSLW